MSDSLYDIQELVNLSGVPRRTVYFYVQQGILPPPQGAGLAAHYTREHLLRLQLIPLLRQRGLRLDEIRKQFEQSSLADLEQMLQPHLPEPARTLPVQPPQAPVIRQSQSPYKAAPLASRRSILYTLPGGITLIVPDDLQPSERQRVELLLGAARRIFSGSPNITPDASLSSGAQFGEIPDTLEEE